MDDGAWRAEVRRLDGASQVGGRLDLCVDTDDGVRGKVSVGTKDEIPDW